MDKKMTALLKQTEEWIDSHRDEFISELQQLTRIPSISRADQAADGAPFGYECRRVLDHILERGKYYGFEVEDHDGYAGSIYLGDKDNCVGLFSHLDVVPVQDGWLYPPFDAVYLKEYDAIIGRGCDDNKCVAVAMLFVLRMLREFGVPLKHGVRLVCGTSEETGMQDMLALRERGMKFPKISLVPDSGFPVNYGQKGSVSGDISIECEGNLLSFDAGNARNVIPDIAECVIDCDINTVKSIFEKINTNSVTFCECDGGTKFTAVGKSTHAASPQNGINAIFLLCDALISSDLLSDDCRSAIKKLHMLTSDYSGKNEGVAYSDDMSGNLSIAYGVAHLENGVLKIKSDCRTPITCGVTKLENDLKSYWESIGFNVDSTSYSKPYYVPLDDPYVTTLQKVFRDVTGKDNQPFVMGGGNYARVVPNAYSFGPGMETKVKISDFLPDGHGACHGKDEAVVMEKAHNCAKIYVLAIAAIDEMLN